MSDLQIYLAAGMSGVFVLGFFIWQAIKYSNKRASIGTPDLSLKSQGKDDNGDGVPDGPKPK